MASLINFINIKLRPYHSRVFKTHILYFLILLLSTPCFSQIKINGTIINNTDKQPIAYVNIGIINSAIGTISNSDGSFFLTIPPAYSKDTIVFSALGFNQKRIPVFYFQKNLTYTIQLSEKIITLQSITIIGEKESTKTYRLGNKLNQGGNIYGDSISAGAAMALLIDNKYPAYHRNLKFPAYVESARLRIAKNTLRKFKIRIRILELDTVTGLPGKDLFEENVITTSGIKEGWINFDLSQYNFKISKAPFFLAFEWILEDQERQDIVRQYMAYKKSNPDNVTLDTVIVDGEKIGFYSWHQFMVGTAFSVSYTPFSLANYKCYYRINSLGEWKRASAILTARIELSNQPEINSAKKSKLR